MDVKKDNRILEEFAETQDWQNIDYGKRNGKRFWIVEAYGKVIEKFNKWLQHSEYLKYVQEESNWDEVRYDDDSVWFDFLTDDNWGYSDQYAKCNHCNCVIEYLSTTSGISSDNYWNCNGELFCEDCIREEPDSYIEDKIINYDTGVISPIPSDRIFSEKELEDFGFTKEIDNLEVGMYGTYDNPHEILNKLICEDKEADYICSIRSSNPFAVYYQIWKRKGR